MNMNIIPCTFLLFYFYPPPLCPPLLKLGKLVSLHLMLSEVRPKEHAERQKIQASPDGRHSHAGLHNCFKREAERRLKNPSYRKVGTICWQIIPQPNAAQI
ncbi:hypothetical protein O3G_MSEX007933 [Manduca sexta]|uniref:Uncharacterized protein n=1 Tax=Manduca sexta TaxID=7130 RepID=A0A921Z912_MANSE|nr:hypothetical protein O3G_MSEX007933 [Manduca sexta]